MSETNVSKIGDNCKLVEIINGSKSKYFQSMVSHVIVISRHCGEILLQLFSMFACFLGFFPFLFWGRIIWEFIFNSFFPL